MNILRQIKIKQVLGELDSLSDNEKIFFSLFNNLIEEDHAMDIDGNEIIFSHVLFLENEDYNSYYFDFDIENKTVWCDKKHVYDKFKQPQKKTEKLIIDILSKHLNMQGYKIYKPKVDRVA